MYVTALTVTKSLLFINAQYMNLRADMTKVEANSNKVYIRGAADDKFSVIYYNTHS